MLKQNSLRTFDVGWPQVVLLLDDPVNQQQSTSSVVGTEQTYLIVTKLIEFAFERLEARRVSELPRPSVCKPVHAGDDARAGPFVSNTVILLKECSRRHVPLCIDCKLDEEVVALLEEIIGTFVRHLKYT